MSDSLLRSCISRLRDMLFSCGMTLADRRRLRIIIEDLEALPPPPRTETDEEVRRNLIDRFVEIASRLALKYLFD